MKTQVNEVKKSKRIKQVFTSSSQVFHLWANQSQEYARQGGRITRAYFRGRSAYSYGQHYEVGRIVEYRGVTLGIVNNTGYSVTTRKHINEAASALEGLMPYLEATTFDVFDALLENQGKLINELMSIFSQRKFYKGYDVFDCNNWLMSRITRFNTIARTLKHSDLEIVPSAEFIQLANAHIQARIKRAEELASPEAEAKREAARLKRQEKELQKNAADVEAWKQGLKPATVFIKDLRPMLIRIVLRNGIEVVETSRGAEVPLSEARAAYRAILQGTAKQGMEVGSFRFGHCNGDIVKIGCHTFDLQHVKAVLGSTAALKVITGGKQ